jgi:hypothetical protein
LISALFFGVGYTAGFFSGFGYSKSWARFDAAGVLYQQPEPGGTSVDTTLGALTADVPQDAVLKETPEGDGQYTDEEYDGEPGLDGIDLVLSGHSLDEDENGLFISGTVVNMSDHVFNAVRIAFDLCDSQNQPYSYVADTATETMEPGDSWGFTLYIPYTEMRMFSSYRLQSIMGVTN